MSKLSCLILRLTSRPDQHKLDCPNTSMIFSAPSLTRNHVTKGNAFVVAILAVIAVVLVRYTPQLLLVASSSEHSNVDVKDNLSIFRRNAIGHNLSVFTVASHSYLSVLMEWLNAPAFTESNFAIAPINVTVVCTDTTLKEELFR